MSDTDNYKPGDKLAFNVYGQWEIHTVDRVTPSGRIICGHRTLNPDLSIRGRRGFGGPFVAYPVTPKIEREAWRQKVVMHADRFNFASLSDGALWLVEQAMAGAKQ
ncbi:hypothetical protein [Stieleria sp.]|uniref:hypothetical protein n=1 Tax=Stieleria sp. TaxID=2795976 RepID=UPI0035698BEF